jgi:hypothetical protein
MEEALLLRASSWADLASLMRLWRIWAYSFCGTVSIHCFVHRRRFTYGSILGSLRATALECDPVALVLETLRSNKTLDLGGLGVRLLALALGLDFAADDELADLFQI